MILKIIIESDNQIKTVFPHLVSLRGDIWVALAADAGAAAAPIVLHCNEPVLGLSFLVPRLGKGGEGKLPTGAMSMFPDGEHVLPPLSGRGIKLFLTVSRLSAILGPDSESLPHEVKKLLTKGGNAQCNVAVPLTPEQVLAGNALMQCPYKGAVKNMFYKSKALELLAFFFSQLAGREGNGTADSLLPEIEAFAGKAREYLLANLESPPSVYNIARHLGINTTKVKRLFKEAFGAAPHTYLRGERMAFARDLLLTRKSNVSEAAVRVGYSNVSHFIDAFVKHYGIRPGELLTRQQKE